MSRAIGALQSLGLHLLHIMIQKVEAKLQHSP